MTEIVKLDIAYIDIDLLMDTLDMKGPPTIDNILKYFPCELEVDIKGNVITSIVAIKSCQTVPDSPDEDEALSSDNKEVKKTFVMAPVLSEEELSQNEDVVSNKEDSEDDNGSIATDKNITSTEKDLKQT